MTRILKTLATVAVSCLSTSGLMADETHPATHEAHAAHEAHAGHMLKGYLKVAESLYKDDVAEAKKAAASMVEHDEESTLAKPAKAVVDAGSIIAAREAFKELSAQAIKLAKTHKVEGYTVMLCPMVKNGKGVWLSGDGKVNNPYFGAKMPHCGGVKE